MTDAFALLQLPRQPWLDADQVRAAFQRLAAEAHPDRSGSATDFAELTRAYGILREPASRLRHFLALEQPDLAPVTEIPADLMAWFPRVAQALKSTTTTPGHAENALTELTALRDATHTRIRAGAADPAELSRLLPRLGFLDKWIAQLEEALLALKL